MGYVIHINFYKNILFLLGERILNLSVVHNITIWLTRLFKHFVAEELSTIIQLINL